MNNPFNNPAFSMVSLTTAINLIPNRYGRLEDMKLFPEKPVRFRQIIVEEKHGVLNLLPTRTPGAPASVALNDKRSVRSFVVPHIPHNDIVLPEEVQGLRAFGSETDIESISDVLAEHLETMRNKHAITLEHLRIGALKGVILDADGSVLVDLFSEFGITPFVVNFALGTAGTNVKGKCLDVARHIEDNLMGEFMKNVHCLCSPEFFDQLTSHPKVEEAYARWQDGAALINDMRADFQYGGITFEEYRGHATNSDGVNRKFIEPGEAHAFPYGTIDTFATYFSPADFNETVNTLGKPIYAKQAPRQFDRGTDLHTQSNPLPMCMRPGVLIKLIAS